MMDNYVETVMNTNENKCGHCGFEMKSALPFDGNQEVEMRPGDIILCDKCLEINTLDENMNFIKPTEEYMNSIPEEMRFEIEKLVKVLKEKRQESQN